MKEMFINNLLKSHNFKRLEFEVPATWDKVLEKLEGYIPIGSYILYSMGREEILCEQFVKLNFNDFLEPCYQLSNNRRLPIFPKHIEASGIVVHSILIPKIKKIDIFYSEDCNQIKRLKLETPNTQIVAVSMKKVYEAKTYKDAYTGRVFAKIKDEDFENFKKKVIKIILYRDIVEFEKVEIKSPIMKGKDKVENYDDFFEDSNNISSKILNRVKINKASDNEILAKILANKPFFKKQIANEIQVINYKDLNEFLTFKIGQDEIGKTISVFEDIHFPGNVFVLSDDLKNEVVEKINELGTYNNFDRVKNCKSYEASFKPGDVVYYADISSKLSVVKQIPKQILAILDDKTKDSIVKSFLEKECIVEAIIISCNIDNKFEIVTKEYGTISGVDTSDLSAENDKEFVNKLFEEYLNNSLNDAIDNL